MSTRSIKVEIVKIISEHSKKYVGENKIRPGCKRVQAIVKGRFGNETRHVDTEDGKIGYQKIKSLNSYSLSPNEKSHESSNKKSFNKGGRGNREKGASGSVRSQKRFSDKRSGNGKSLDRRNSFSR
jgi:hypothetical protein